MIGWLWRNRERPAVTSRRWLVVWAKRALTFRSLLRMMARAARLRRRGACIGDLAVLEKCFAQGHASRLSIGEGCFIGEGTRFMLHEKISIGSRVVINRDVTILTASHDVCDPQWRMYCRPVVIGDYAWIATGAMLLPGVRIGRGAVVGAGAVVRQDVPPHAVVAGNPAVVLAARRSMALDYQPVFLAAELEAWLGSGKGGPG